MDAIFHFDLTALVIAAGYLGIFLIVFAESGILIGFFLPGDSLLFTAGFLASAGYLNLALVLIVIIIGAILGDQVGYLLGRKYGPKIFKREESIFFKKRRIDEARIFFEKHGKKTIIFARFIPFVRTVVPIFAGIGKMDYPVFVKYNVAGGIFWGGSITIAGYFLGEIIPDIDSYLLPIIIAIVIVSVLPGIISFLYSKTREKK